MPIILSEQNVQLSFAAYVRLPTCSTEYAYRDSAIYVSAVSTLFSFFKTSRIYVPCLRLIRCSYVPEEAPPP